MYMYTRQLPRHVWVSFHFTSSELIAKTLLVTMKLIAYVLLALLHRCVAQPVDPGQSQQPGKPQFVLDPVCSKHPRKFICYMPLKVTKGSIRESTKRRR